MKKVLIIGGAGFIGMNIARHLAKRDGYKITLADNFFRGNKDAELEKFTSENGIDVIEGDLTDPSLYSKFDNDYDYVYMLASVVGVDYTTSMPNEIIRINTALIFNTLEWLKTTQCKKTLFTSTSECYVGAIEAFGYTVPTPEDIPLCIQDIGHPRFTYATTKMLGESGFINYARVFDFDSVIVRYHNVYGPRMGFKHVIPHIIQRFLNNENPFQVYGHDQTRSFCYIDDAVQSTVLAMEQEDENGEIYHIGTMEEITIGELIRYTGSLMNYEGEYENAPTYPGSVSRRCPDITKATERLGYEPKVNWKEGLKKTVDWYVEYIQSGKELHESFYDNKSKS